MKRPRGFTAIETIFSAFVVAVVMMALFNLFPTTTMAIRKAEMRTYANGLASRYLETYRALPFDEIPLGPAIPARETMRDVQFTVTPEVFTPTGAQADLLKGIRVTVSWTDKGRTYTVQHEGWLVHVEG